MTRNSSSGAHSRVSTLASLGMGVCVSAFLATNGASAAIDLLDLAVPPARIQPFFPADQAEATYLAARAWPEYDVTCTGAACGGGGIPGWDQAPKRAGGTLATAGCSSVTTTSPERVNCMIANVDTASGGRVFVFPARTYTQVHGGQIINLRTNNVVLRGRPGATFSVTTPEQGSLGLNNCTINDLDGAGSLSISVCKPDYLATSTAWTSGYTTGTQTLGVSSTAGFSVGGWAYVTVTANNAAQCVYLQNPIPGVETVLSHITKVTAIGVGTITVDRPLRMSFIPKCRTNARIHPMSPLLGVGVEGFTFRYDRTPVSTSNFVPPVTTAGTVESYVVDNVLQTWGNFSMRFSRGSARNWFQRNKVDRVGGGQYPGANIQAANGAQDNVFENNICTDSQVCFEFSLGAGGNVVAYNYMRQDTTPWNDRRALFSHGTYTHAHLWEGNDVDSTIVVSDCYWGYQGPGITVYRNRNSDSAADESLIQTGSWFGETCFADPDGINGKTYIDGPVNIIGNSVAGLCNKQVPGCQNALGVDYLWEDSWIERNTFREAFIVTQPMASPGTSCGTGSGDQCPGTNQNRSNAHSDAGVRRFPTSLYRTTAPSWWCQEACPWSDRGIGAFGDSTTGPVCKLPAQIFQEGGACTLSGGSPPLQPPQAPTLLP